MSEVLLFDMSDYVLNFNLDVRVGEQESRKANLLPASCP
jgi:hypothetical protein